MNKESELEIFNIIYGSYSDWKVIDSESPDFLCTKNGTTTLGVEVTEFYVSESCARLRNIETYTEELLSGADYRHKEDIEKLKVENIQFIKENNEPYEDTEAIIQDVPPFNEIVKLLEKAMLTKELKTPIYLQSCPKVDLAILDASNSLIFSDFKDFFIPFSTSITKQLVLESAFREIFLVTQKYNKNGGYSKVVVPLKLNLFAQASTIYVDLILEKLGTTSDEYDIELQNIFLSCLNQTGFSHFETLEIEGEFCIALGCYLYIYTKDGIKIRDYTRLSGEYPVGITVSNILKRREIQNLNIVEEILEKSNEFQCYVPLYFEEKYV